MHSIVICGFPGIGKSYVAEHHDDVLDLESSAFSGNRDAWPDNYIHRIQSEVTSGKYRYILVSSHKEVRVQLASRGIEFICVVPAIGLEEEYSRRYFARGNSVEFISNIQCNWRNWIFDIARTCTCLVLQSGEYLSDILTPFIK